MLTNINEMVVQLSIFFSMYHIIRKYKTIFIKVCAEENPHKTTSSIEMINHKL